MHQEIVTYIKKIVAYRLAIEFDEDEPEFPLFDFSNDKAYFSKFVTEENLAAPEIITLLIALLPQIAPGFLSKILSEYYPEGSEFPEFGGIKGTNYRGIIPTAQTVLYIIAGNDIERRNLVAQIFDESHVFYKKSILTLSSVTHGEPKLSGKLLLDQEYLDLFLYESISKPKLSQDFPAERIETALGWDDLVLSDKTRNHVNDILIWLKFNETVLDELSMKGKIKPGYRVMFFGPPGVGKTLTASLLGKLTKRDVYRIDLSLVVSKYIGETEKNLSKLFDKARNKDWILFFDEADAIFGKRTGVRDAHDKYANQEVSYLLQRIEAHPGLVVLASNYKSNIDKAFTRRFQAIIEFENPTKTERTILWRNNIPESLLTEEIDIEALAKEYELTGANIVNIVQQACLQMFAKNNTKLTKETLFKAIQREYVKEGRMI